MSQAFAPEQIMIVTGAKAGKTERFAARELAGEIRSVTGKRPKVVSEKKLDKSTASGKLLFILGTRQGSELISGLAAGGKCKVPAAVQGYSIRTIPNPVASTGTATIVAGADERGALHGVRDLQHYYLEHDNGRVLAPPLDLSSAEVPRPRPPALGVLRHRPLCLRRSDEPLEAQLLRRHSVVVPLRA